MEAIEAISLLFALMIAGSIFKVRFSSERWFARASKTLIDFIYWILVPLTFIETFSIRGITSDLVLPFLSSTILITAVWIIMRFFRPISDSSIEKGVLLNSTVQNNLFVGFPVLYSLFKDAVMSLYFGFVAFIFAILLPDVMGKGKFSISIFLKNPVIIGMAIGLAIHLTIPTLSSDISSTLFWAPTILSYLSIFATGLALQMNLEPVKKNSKAFLINAIFKFILNPFVNIVLLNFFHLPPLYRNEVIILSLMPPASFNTVMAMKYNWEPEFVASSSFFLTMVSLVLVIITYHLI